MDQQNYYIEKQKNEMSKEERKQFDEKYNALDLTVLEEIEKRETVTQRGVFSPLDAVEVAEIEKKREEFYQVGTKALQQGKVAAVLLAGGQGTRLGLDIPKGCCNIGVTQELYIFECHFKNLLEVSRQVKAYVPLYIMTSKKNKEETIQFLEEHGYFGYPKEYVHFFAQDMFLTVDMEGRILLKDKGEFALAPNGNGGWFYSMKTAGLLTQLKESGIEWINVFAVDNVLQKIADPYFVGATIVSGYQSGAKVVRKAAPDEKVGVLCLEDGKPSIAEYYEMTEEMATARKENGDLKYGFGVILNYLFKESKLEEIVDNHMPIHVVKKKVPYMDEKGNCVEPSEPNAYKFETLVLDMVHMMDSCLPYEVVREEEFAPIKNLHGVDSLDSARELLQNNGIIL